MIEEFVEAEEEQNYLPYCLGNIRQDVVSTSNRLIRPIELSPNEYKALLYAMAAANDAEKNSGDKVITERTYIKLNKDKLAELLGLNKRNSINVAIDRIYKELSARVAHFVIEEPVVNGKKKTKTVHSVVPIIREMRWDSDLKTAFHIRFTSEVLPYFTQLASGNFTTYQLKHLFALDSIQSISLYTYFVKSEFKYANEPKYEMPLSLENLKALIDIGENKYDRWVDFRRYVLDKIVEEINNCTDLTVSYETIKNGRPIVGVKFIIEHEVEVKQIESDNNVVKVYLDVPFEDNAQVKELGARFDKDVRTWFILSNFDNYKEFKKWFKTEGCLTDSQASVLLNDTLFQMEFAESGESLADFKRRMRKKLKKEPEFVSSIKERITEVLGTQVI